MALFLNFLFVPSVCVFWIKTATISGVEFVEHYLVPKLLLVLFLPLIWTKSQILELGNACSKVVPLISWYIFFF